MFCVLRLNLLDNNIKNSCCTGHDNILRGCPMVKELLGCRSKHNICEEIQGLKVFIKNGVLGVNNIKCKHNVDKINVKYNKDHLGVPDNVSKKIFKYRQEQGINLHPQVLSVEDEIIEIGNEPEFDNL